MDKYVVRRQRCPQEKNVERKQEPKLRQITIKSLSRVVVVEDILHLKSALEAHKGDTTPDKLLEILERLKCMNPSIQMLKHTRIGRCVNKLRKCEHQSVRKLSEDIVKVWKKLVEDESAVKESIDVQCDAKTELLRCKARKLIAESLNVNLPNAWTEAVEKRLFQECQKRVTNEYKRRVRSVVFLVKSDGTLIENLKRGVLSPQDIISRSFTRVK